jgi:hypothetical protein
MPGELTSDTAANVKSFKPREITVDVESPESYVRGPLPGEVLLRDYVLDKNVLDIEEVEFVYDIRLSVTAERVAKRVKHWASRALQSEE